MRVEGSLHSLPPCLSLPFFSIFHRRPPLSPGCLLQIPVPIPCPSAQNARPKGLGHPHSELALGSPAPSQPSGPPAGCCFGIFHKPQTAPSGIYIFLSSPGQTQCVVPACGPAVCRVRRCLGFACLMFHPGNASGWALGGGVKPRECQAPEWLLTGRAVGEEGGDASSQCRRMGSISPAEHTATRDER